MTTFKNTGYKLPVTNLGHFPVYSVFFVIQKEFGQFRILYHYLNVNINFNDINKLYIVSVLQWFDVAEILRLCCLRAYSIPYDSATKYIFMCICKVIVFA